MTLPLKPMTPQLEPSKPKLERYKLPENPTREEIEYAIREAKRFYDIPLDSGEDS